MGTDIHVAVEHRYLRPQDYRWEHFLNVPIIWRNYSLFALMADVRNDGRIIPISKPKGLPSDITEQSRKFLDDNADHSFSWLDSIEYDKIYNSSNRNVSNSELCLLLKWLHRIHNNNISTSRIIFGFDS